MKAQEMETLKKFLNHLVKEELANGSDQVAYKLKDLTLTLLPWNTVEDVAESVHEIYFDDAMELLERHEK